MIHPNEVARLAAEATPGPWKVTFHTEGGTNNDWTISSDTVKSIAYEGGSIGLPDADGHFIARAHDMAELIALMQSALRAQIYFDHHLATCPCNGCRDIRNLAGELDPTIPIRQRTAP